MEGPLITIIVPIYNVAVYMDRCVDSLLHQDYSNLEIILVDDGSTDGSAQRCDEWAQRDPRIKVIHQANGGLSAARNAALNIMMGDYVTMLDGDDFVSTTFVSTLLNIINTTGASLAAAAWTLFTDGTEPHIDTTPGKVTTFTSAQAINNVFYQHTLTNSACCKLFKSSLFNNVRFPVGMLYEDLAVIYDLLSQATTVAHTSQSLYYYRQRTSGSITSSFSRRRTHVLNITEDLEQRIAAEAPQHLAAVRSRRLSACFNIMLLCPDDGTMDDVIDRCWAGIKALRWQCLTDPRVRTKNKIGALLSYLGKWTVRLFRH